MPGGGIIPTRSFRITFSQVSAPWGTFVRSACSSDSPPSRLLSLWHVTQYLPTTAACVAEGGSIGCCFARAATDGPTEPAAIKIATQRANDRAVNGRTSKQDSL